MDNNHMEEKYKATKLWNDAIRSFRNQMPVKLHRKHFKSFADTFTGTEAVDWLHGYLSAKAAIAQSNDCLETTSKRSQPILNKITRDQTLALLNKFFDYGLFEPAKSSKTNGNNQIRVKDDGFLFKFSNISPSKVARTPLALKNNSRADVNNIVNSGSKTTPTSRKAFSFNNRPTMAVTPISYRKLPDVRATTTDEQEDKAASNGHSKLQARRSIIDDLLAIDADKDSANGQSQSDEKTTVAAPSTTFFSRQGSIRGSVRTKTETEKKDDSNLPHLQFVARQLSLEEVENVWKTLSLLSLRQLLRLEDNSFDEFTFITGRDICHNAKQFTPRGVTRVFSKLDDLPGWTLQAMKCLANWPWKNNELNWPCYPGFERDVFATVLDFFATQPNPLIPVELQELMLEVLNRVEYLDVQQWDATNDVLTQSPPAFRAATIPRSKADDDISVETEFGPRSPITRMIEREPARSRASVSCSSSAPTRHPQHQQQQDDVLTGLRSEFEANVRSLEEILASLPGLVKSPRLLRELRELREKNGKQAIDVKDEKTPPSIQSAQTSPDRDLVAQFDGRVLTGLLNLPGARFSVASTMTGSFASGSPPSAVSHSAYGSGLGFFTRTGRQIACQALQLCLLFMPPKNRRWLQLLLRMMNKICVNYCLRLDKHNSASNRSIVLESFCDLIVTRTRDGGLSMIGNIGTRQQRMKLTTFLLDSLNEVFAPPTELIANIETRIRQMQRAKICYNGPQSDSLDLTVATSNGNPLTFCERISPKQYQMQAAFSSRRALEQLMDSIADDMSLSGAEKKRRLKKFKDSYPDLFYQRFPNKASFESLIKSSNGSLNKAHENGVSTRPSGPFGRLVSMRL